MHENTPTEADISIVRREVSSVNKQDQMAF